MLAALNAPARCKTLSLEMLENLYILKSIFNPGKALFRWSVNDHALLETVQSSQVSATWLLPGTTAIIGTYVSPASG